MQNVVATKQESTEHAMLISVKKNMDKYLDVSPPQNYTNYLVPVFPQSFFVENAIYHAHETRHCHGVCPCCLNSAQ